MDADENGTLTVALVHQAPKKKENKRAPREKPPVAKEAFNYPTPQDLTKKDLAPNKPLEQLKAEKEEEKKAKVKAEAEAKTRKSQSTATPDEKLPEISVRAAAVKPLSHDNAWRHIFFTYDGSGFASGVKIYVDGVHVATQVVIDNLR